MVDDLGMEQAPTGAVPTLLVVDDDEMVRTTTARILARAGYEVVQAANAAEALLRCEQGLVPDLVLSDVVMPGESGYDLARRLRDRHPDLAVLLFSGYTPAAIARHGMDGEGFPLLQKPVRAADLVAAVQDLVGAAA